MIKTLAIVLTAVAAAMSACAQTPATLIDMGSDFPVVGAHDIYQTNWDGGAQKPDGLNYYVDNASPPGETFTTGSNPNGYVVTSLSLQTSGDSGQLPAAGQNYLLSFFTISDSTNATLLATYESQNNFTFVDNDWLEWTNLGLALPANGNFAYSFGRVPSGAGWENMGTSSGPPSPTIYVDGLPSAAGGDVALIPASGGVATLGASSNYVATFDLGLAVASAPVVNAPVFAPSSAVTAGTAVTISTLVVGAGPLTYQWKTDGGNGGTLTNIPGATGATLSLNTANWNPGPYEYDVVISNASGAVTSAVGSLGIRYPTATASLADVGQNIVSGVDDINQFVGSGGGNGLNYYDDNGASHGGNYIGQTFVTGTNSQGYYVDTVGLQTGGTGGSSATTTLQFYHLFFYSISGNTATLLAHYTNNPLFGFTFGDWVVWSGFSLKLKPNSTYAYTFGRDASGTGWAALNYSPTNAPGPYPQGQICAIPQNGGTIQPGAGNAAAVFDLGLIPIGVGPSPVPFANPVIVTPTQFVLAGTQVKLNENASGQAPLRYYWQADGGTGAITNVPGNNSSNLVVDTTGFKPGVYQYDVVASNSFGFSKSATLNLTVVFAETSATLDDIGTTTPTVGTSDVAQPVFGTSQDVGGSLDGLNYYFDNGKPPGQVFSTGNNSGGYVLTTLAMSIVDQFSTPADGQNYFLRLYSVNGTNATLYAQFESAPNFMFIAADWLRWSGFAVPLAANSSYAFTFGRDPGGSGWGSLASVSNVPPVYNGGACAISPNGGPVTYTTSRNEDATFIAGMSLAQDPSVSPPVVSPAGTIYAGTVVTLSANAGGPGPFTYQWVTDGGSGGTLTNIPGATSSTLQVDTAPLNGLNVTYEVIVSNGAGSTKSATTVLGVAAPSAPTVATDVNITSETLFAGGSLTLDASFVGTLPIRYQWQVDKGSGPVNVPGGTAATLTLNNLKTTDSGTYTLTATNSVGSGASSSAQLTVVPVPAAPFTVDFQWHSTENNSDVGNYTGPGVSGYGAGTYWNQVMGPSAFTAGTYGVSNALADDGVTQTGFQWVLNTGGSWDWSSAPTIALLDSGASANNPVIQTFTFTLPNGTYDVVLFSCDGTEALTRDSQAAIALAGQTHIVTPTNDTAFILGETYTVFTNVSVSGNVLSGTWTGVNPGQLASLNGAQLRYLSSTVSTAALSVSTVANGNVQLQWSGGTLLQSASVTGPWTTNTASSPYTVTPSANGPQMFYKLSAP